MEKQEPQYFTRTSDIWDAMYEDAAGAKISIELDQYILEQDQVGQRFLSLFIKKAQEGVSVHLLLDFIGSYKAYNTPMIQDLVRAGGHVRFYNKLPKHRIFQPARWFPRNHVKVLLVDSDIAYVGSACMRDDMAGWRDSTVRLVGDDAHDVERQFAFSRLIWWKRPGSYRQLKAISGHRQYIFSIRRPGVGINPIYRDMIHAIRRSSSSVLITTPYFLAPYALRRAIRAAARRGVKVRIITNVRSDVRIADLVSASYFKRLMRRGVEIYAYRPFMLHAKVVIVDDNWASIGSTNIDYLSLRVNREANLVIHDPRGIATLKAQFENDINSAAMITEASWYSLSLWERALGYMGRSIKAIL